MSAPQGRLLLIEDDPQIRRVVRLALAEEGWDVQVAEKGQQGLELAGTIQPDLLIVDLGLPDMDGVMLIRDFRAWSLVPVLVLSARNSEPEKVEALDAGADDYLTKPFGVSELRARVRALTRRLNRAEKSSPEVCFADVCVDFSRRTVLRAAAPVHLTPLEYRLLVVMLANANKVLTHRFLMQEVWGGGYSESSHYLRIYVSRLRQKLEADPAQPRHFLTETAVGYRFQF